MLIQPEKGHEDLEKERIWFLHFKKDPEKYEQIVTEYSAAVSAYLYRLSGDYEISEDLTQETFVQAFSGFLKFEWRGISMGAFIFKVARNVFNGWCKGNKHYKEIQYDLSELEIDSGETSDAVMLRGKDQAILASCMERLPEKQREVLGLFYWSGMRTWEIAKIMKMGEPAVKSQLHRGKIELKEQLQAMGLDHTSFNMVSEPDESPMQRENDWNISEKYGREGA